MIPTLAPMHEHATRTRAPGPQAVRRQQLQHQHSSAQSAVRRVHEGCAVARERRRQTQQRRRHASPRMHSDLKRKPTVQGNLRAASRPTAPHGALPAATRHWRRRC